jgi:hypothetical protein
MAGDFQTIFNATIPQLHLFENLVIETLEIV